MRLSMDLESPAEVGGDNGEVYFFSFGLSVEWVKREHILGYRFTSIPEGEHQRQNPQGRKSMARPKAASHTHIAFLQRPFLVQMGKQRQQRWRVLSLSAV